MSGEAALPPLVLRVGVTGSRHFSPERTVALRARVDEVLRHVVAETARLAQNPRARPVYAKDASGRIPISLRLVSPLAEGADRLVAEAALDLGFDLVAPLPFAQADYETDFPEAAAAFRTLLGKAHVIELDGGRGAAETLSYQAVGRFVVRNCDLLIALWDGEPARGQGGTAEIARFSARSDVPVWWIDVATGATRFIADAAHWRLRRDAPTEDQASARLADYLANLLLPPVVAHPERHGVLGLFAHHYCRILGRDPHPLDVFFAEPMPSPTSPVWRTFAALYRFIAKPSAQPSPAGVPPESEIQRHWQTRYERADALSVLYGDKYRSSYVLIILFAFLAFVVSIVGSIVATDAVEAALELSCLAVIGGLVWLNHVERWQERWISYRLIAELCRKQVMLVPLGRTLPGTDVARLTLESSTEHDLASLPREAWVSWYYLATLRAAPMPPRSSSDAKRSAFGVARQLVTEQDAYHRARHRRAGTADRRLTRYSDWFFVSTCVGLVAVLLLLMTLRQPHSEAAGAIETVATLFSGASAALVGLRAYAEFALLSQQSLRMGRIMQDIAADLDSLDLDAPLASQELGTILQRLAGLMMQDVSGWAQLFRLKTVEAG